MPMNRQAEGLERVSVSASDAKKEFARMLDTVNQGRLVVITKHDTPKAVMMSIEDYQALAQAGEVKLEALSHEFDALFAQMQTPAARRGMKAAFDASPKALGRAAVARAHKRG
jgi:prevent-host-death family protein